jgi:hypothetical protein
MTLLAHGGQRAANATKGGRALLAAKGCGDLLLDVDHAQVAPGLIVGKGEREIVQSRMALCCE